MLHAFHNLRLIVESDSVPRFPINIRAMEPEKRWGWFVNIAVERFVEHVSLRTSRLKISQGLTVGAAVLAHGAL